MIESLKALFVVSTLSIAAFIYARSALGVAIPAGTINRWRNLFLAVTAVAFLVPNFWLMLAAMSAAVAVFGASEKFRPALYLLLLFAVPVASKTVPGFGGINNFLALYPFNVLAIAILFPLLLRRNEVRGAGAGGLAEICFIVYALVVLALSFRNTTFTDGIRSSTAFVMTAIPQYFVFSRIRWTAEKARLATAAFAIPLIALSGIAAAEAALHWHFYTSAVESWNVATALRYGDRSGFLRAYGPIFGPITFGVFLAVGLALAPALLNAAPNKRLAALSIPAIGTGLLVTFSRGPWVGGVLAIAAYAATTRRWVTNLAKLSLAGAVLLGVLAVTPFGSTILNLIPFIGNAEEGSIDYRQRLFEIGWRVVMQNPLLGSEGYLDTPAMQQLIQGQGIIDIVNTYLRIALDSGLIGLSAYLGAVGFAVLAAFRAIGPARRINGELASYCQAYFAALLSMSVVLATTSNTIAQVQEVTWVLCGMCVGLARSVALERRELKSTTDKGLQTAIASAEQSMTPNSSPSVSSQSTRPLPPHLRQYVKR